MKNITVRNQKSNLKKEDLMDKFSHPKKIIEYKLGKLFYMNPRRSLNKTGRELVVAFDQRFPIIPGFKINYSYYLRFLEDKNCAGNHYHKKKREIFIPIHGNFTLILENIITKEKEEVLLDSKKYSMFYINSRIAHMIKAHKAGSILLVLATSANNDKDEFKYILS